jgi:hypothetical protein
MQPYEKIQNIITKHVPLIITNQFLESPPIEDFIDTDANEIDDFIQEWHSRSSTPTTEAPPTSATQTPVAIPGNVDCPTSDPAAQLSIATIKDEILKTLGNEIDYLINKIDDNANDTNKKINAIESKLDKIDNFNEIINQKFDDTIDNKIKTTIDAKINKIINSL